MNARGYDPLVERCCFCSGSDLRPHSEASYWGECDLHFVECAGCGLIFANPMPDLETIVEGNRALNSLHVSRGIVPQYRGGKAFSLFLRSIKPGGIMLDVGCAEGLWLLGVEENSAWKAEGLDILESAVTFATRRLGLTVHLGTLETLEGGPNRYDVIRMNNVIEHVQNPVNFLRAANRLLKDRGRVHCTTPNGFQDGHILKRANRRGIKMNLLENHFTYYHPRTLAQLFVSSGFRIRKAWCEDTRHSLNDFGFTPWSRISSEAQSYKLSSFLNRTVAAFDLSDGEIRALKTDPAVAWWRIRLRQVSFPVRFPASVPIGHQQYLFAEKVEDR